jgi:hypothetical protein
MSTAEPAAHKPAAAEPAAAKPAAAEPAAAEPVSFHNNELGFEAENVVALCNMGGSTKSAGDCAQ